MLTSSYPRSIHPDMSFDSNDTRVCMKCYNCEELVDSRYSRLPVCSLRLHSWSELQLRKKMKEVLLIDPARAISAHVLASLLLFPNAYSPLCLTPSAARKIWSKSKSIWEGLPSRVMSAISALRGCLLFIERNPYKRVLGCVVNFRELQLPLHLRWVSTTSLTCSWACIHYYYHYVYDRTLSLECEISESPSVSTAPKRARVRYLPPENGVQELSTPPINNAPHSASTLRRPEKILIILKRINNADDQ